MINCHIKAVCVVVLMSFLIFPFQALAKRDVIDISNPSLRKIPIAIPLFKKMPYGHTNMEITVSGTKMCSQALEFTGYFKILDRGSFLEDPEKLDITGSAINFRNWTGVGAELLITGGFWIKDNVIEMELRLFDTFEGKMLIGKKYKGWPDDLRRMIRRFCNEVIQYLTGVPGIFDSKIAFVSTSSGNKEIYTCDFDGQNVKPFTRNKAITLFPGWSSDGKWIAYTSYVKGKPDIYIRHLKDGRGFVVNRKGINTTPAWVPGSFRLAATLSYQGDQDIYLLTGRGEIIRRLTRAWGIDTSPAWSPDGAKMAFVSNRSGKPQVHIMHVSSGRVERLTFEGKYNTQPSWSPRGDRVAYSAREKNGRFNICVIGFDGGGPIRLTYNSGDNESPSWSPDGSMIVFSTTREGPSRIYVMTAYGTEQRRLAALPGNQTSPVWSPSDMGNY
ncbi:Tol-Pal system beta propeller repeat protein TolB [Desulfococcaceae bacterium HSG8]|nr:Tol-Pal system beta propeller repeat protein TolB [Desulfococcaceae bacterium HSG8]